MVFGLLFGQDGLGVMVQGFHTKWAVLLFGSTVKNGAGMLESRTIGPSYEDAEI